MNQGALSNFNGYILCSSEVSSRHVLTALTGVSTLSGVLIVYVLGYSANWRSVALYCSFGSILAFIILLFVRASLIILFYLHGPKI